MNWGILIIAVLSMSIVNAATSVDYAYVILEVVNQEPSVEVDFSDKVKAGNEISCPAIVIDENPSTVSLKTEWYLNDQLVQVGGSFGDYKKGDRVGCLVIPTDQYGLVGTAYGVETTATGFWDIF
jgi:hypothetical protein